MRLTHEDEGGGSEVKLFDMPVHVVRFHGMAETDDHPSRPRRTRKRAENKVAPFLRGFILACMVRDGVKITSKMIRERFGVSAAAAKRDKAVVTRLIAQFKPKQAGSGVVAGRLLTRGYTELPDLVSAQNGIRRTPIRKVRT